MTELTHLQERRRREQLEAIREINRRDQQARVSAALDEFARLAEPAKNGGEKQ